MSVCVCERERSACVCERVCVCERESECVCGRESVAGVFDDPMQEPHLPQTGGWRVRVSVCERERKKECV